MKTEDERLAELGKYAGTIGYSIRMREYGEARYTLCERSAIPEDAKRCKATEHLFSEPHMY